ncbi:MAG: hypothetical protein LKG19_11735 [Saprospiraceae bacterium]|jgi:hypothetical protein|nr:hypothetical protein [Saprospiraceae bacterium]
MGFLSKLFTQKYLESKLLGSWIADSIKMTFTSNGKLIYEISENDKVSIINMTYELSGDIILTNQPSHPRTEKTRYDITDNILTLDFNGEISKYKKII